jgi:hypothetical protein
VGKRIRDQALDYLFLALNVSAGGDEHEEVNWIIDVSLTRMRLR